MRESFGGAFMIKLILAFIIIYVSFMAVAVSYAKAFRVKNGIVNILEQNQYTGNVNISDAVIVKVDDYLKKIPYYVPSASIKNSCDSYEGNLTEQGACIVPMGSVDDSSRYYKVITYIAIDFPFFDIHTIIPISGETSTIKDWR
jgi:hypothetical protein